jgi:hypothetical protein
MVSSRVTPICIRLRVISPDNQAVEADAPPIA